MSILQDGHQTLITFANYPSVAVCEKEVQPPGVEGGGANDITCMQNTTWRTRAPKKLKTLSDSSLSVSYDPAVYDDIVAMTNENQLVTITFPDGSTLAFWGWVDAFTPNALVEGEQPTADMTIMPSNVDDAGDEVAPVFTAAP